MLSPYPIPYGASNPLVKWIEVHCTSISECNLNRVWRHFVPKAVKSNLSAIFGAATSVLSRCDCLGVIDVVASRNEISIRLRFSTEMTLTTLRNSPG